MTPSALNVTAPTTRARAERCVVAGEGHAVRDHAERRREHGDEHGDNRAVEQDSAKHGPGGQRRRPCSLEHSALSAKRQRDGELRVGRRHDAEGDDRGDVVLVVVEAAEEVDGRAVVQRREDDQEDQREREREEGTRRVAPVALLLVAQLPQQQPHDGSAVVSARYRPRVTLAPPSVDPGGGRARGPSSSGCAASGSARPRAR